MKFMCEFLSILDEAKNKINLIYNFIFLCLLPSSLSDERELLRFQIIFRLILQCLV